MFRSYIFVCLNETYENETYENETYGNEKYFRK